ncbi:MAG: DUF262 domain-containing HNH endonuclease family protein [Erysipelotrichaceae bacterium]|nr:DUF262 domain-containing HNH endonuclease family protein [Erysipelotrichaceae bacterium]
MAKSIEPNLRKIGDYLKLDEDASFVIPEYQRAYSWGTDNCDKLWQDVNDFVASDSKDRYFFGTIIINCQDNDEKFVLIDGQQRTTTFLLLLKSLLISINKSIEKMVEDEDSEGLANGLKARRRKIMNILYKAEAEDVSDKPDISKDKKLYQRSCILENHSINETYKTELEKILGAYNFDEAESMVVHIPYKQKDNKYTNFFRNFKFFYERVQELSPSALNSIAKAITESCEVIEIKSWQVEQAITMFNSLNSDGLPLYDSDIISAKMYAEAEKNEQGKEFTDAWKELKDIIAILEPKGIANIDSILMQHMYYVRAVNKETITETGSINVTTPGLRRYYTEINKEIIKNPVDSCQNMINLAKVWLKVSQFSIVRLLLKFNENSKLFLSSYFCRFKAEEVTEETVSSIVECFLRLFTVLELVDTGYSSSQFKTFLFGENVKLVDKTVPVYEIKADFDAHINSKWEKTALLSSLLDYDRHMLVYLNEFLFARENGLSFNLGEKYDIEHIMPSSGSNLPEIRKDADLSDEDEFKSYVNKLGNKIVLEEKINRSIGNEWFRTKVSTSLGNKTGYIDSTYPIANYLVACYRNAEKPYWKKGDIEGATQKAAKRIVNYIFGS